VCPPSRTPISPNTGLGGMGNSLSQRFVARSHSLKMGTKASKGDTAAAASARLERRRGEGGWAPACTHPNPRTARARVAGSCLCCRTCRGYTAKREFRLRKHPTRRAAGAARAAGTASSLARVAAARGIRGGVGPGGGDGGARVAGIATTPLLPRSCNRSSRGCRCHGRRRRHCKGRR